MSAEAGGTVALAANWLEPVNAMSNASASASASPTFTGFSNNSMGWCGDPIQSTVTIYNPGWWRWPQPYYQPYYVPITTYVNVPEKIRLKSSEVDRLRMAAKRDAKLKAILQKFTPFIEVELEF